MCEGDHQPETISRRRVLRAGALTAGAAAIGPHLLRWGGATLDVSQVSRIAQVATPAPPIITRAEWGADETLRTSSRAFAPITKAIVHHTAIEEVDPAAQVRGIYRSHTQTNKWADIGYNFLVDREGRIYEGRWARDYVTGEDHSGEDTSGRLVEGAHAEGRNPGSVGIAILGNYELQGATIPDEALVSVARIIAWKFGPRTLDPYGRTPYTLSNGTAEVFDNICGHRDVATTTTHTSCPGDVAYQRLNDIRGMVAAQTTTGLQGVRLLGADGSLWNYGRSPAFGKTADIGDPRRNVRPGLPVRTAAGTATGQGAWVAGTDGSVYSFGDAGSYGSLAGKRLNKPIVGMAPTPTGLGYWLVASDGGIFTFGDAKFFGSTGSLRLNKPIVGMTATSTGAGYWLVASDGGIFSFGDARFHGSTGSIKLVQPILGMATAPDGAGYWMVARDGGVFTFGSAKFLGSAVGRKGFSGQAAALAPTPTGLGYWILDTAGGLHPFGDAPAFGGGVTAGSRPALALVPVVVP
ncbi:MAG: hypothetical protein JWO68_3795 [Actinomycetia bacterium]|nr:hypothetical protein [Actinomycetes bacterium]